MYILNFLSNNIKGYKNTLLVFLNKKFNYTKLSIVSLLKIESHYLKKENLIFSYMEKYKITAPPKVMWGVDDEIRFLILLFS